MQLELVSVSALEILWGLSEKVQGWMDQGRVMTSVSSTLETTFPSTICSTTVFTLLVTTGSVELKKINQTKKLTKMFLFNFISTAFSFRSSNSLYHDKLLLLNYAYIEIASIVQLYTDSEDNLEFGKF